MNERSKLLPEHIVRAVYTALADLEQVTLEYYHAHLDIPMPKLLCEVLALMQQVRHDNAPFQLQRAALVAGVDEIGSSAAKGDLAVKAALAKSRTLLREIIEMEARRELRQ